MLSYQAFPTIFDPITGTASAVEVHVILRLTLRERATGKILYSRPNYEIRERYEISALDPTAYFEESDVGSGTGQPADRSAGGVIDFGSLLAQIMTPDQFL